jgi:hypothetical protein
MWPLHHRADRHSRRFASQVLFNNSESPLLLTRVTPRAGWRAYLLGPTYKHHFRADWCASLLGPTDARRFLGHLCSKVPKTLLLCIVNFQGVKRHFAGYNFEVGILTFGWSAILPSIFWRCTPKPQMRATIRVCMYIHTFIHMYIHT